MCRPFLLSTSGKVRASIFAFPNDRGLKTNFERKLSPGIPRDDRLNRLHELEVGKLPQGMERILPGRERNFDCSGSGSFLRLVVLACLFWDARIHERYQRPAALSAVAQFS